MSIGQYFADISIAGRPIQKACCKRSFRFSLGTLLFSITVFAIWLGVQTDQANRQRRAIAGFEELGLAIHYDLRRTPSGFSSSPKPNWIHSLTGHDDFQTVLGLSGTPNNERFTNEHLAYAATSLHDVRDLSLFNSDITDAGLVHVAKLRQLQGLMLSDAKITDAGLKHLAGLRNLENLFLRGSDITGAGLVHLKRSTKLRMLYVQKTAVNDDGLAHVAQFKNLRILRLTNTKVTDNGLVHLVSLRDLAILDLSRTDVTDAGLIHLEKLSNLRNLALVETGVTAQGVADLRQKLPDCHISWR